MKNLFLGIFLINMSYGETKKETYIAKALKENGDFIYTEKTEITYSDDKIKTIISTYSDPSEKEFAKSQSRFESMDYLPQFEFNDSRMEKKEGLTIVEKKAELFYKEDTTSELEKKLFTPDESTVVIQGFPAYIRQNLKDFIDGKTKKISLLLPSMMRDLSFDVKAVPIEEGKLKIEILISNWFLKIFTDKIEIVYDTKLKRFISYYGITVIRKSGGGNDKYKITYQYE